MHESFLRYRRFFYLWVALALVLGSSLAYVLHDPLEPPNGGTWLGYTLGIIGAVLIVWLMLFGMRKRAYRSTLGTVRGWLSAHVYLGVALVVVATLHAGFQLGWNIHTLAWVLMMIVVLSGVYGAWSYARYPAMITRNRDNLTRNVILKEISEIDRKASLLVEALGSPVDRIVISANQLFRVGGGIVAQLAGLDRSRVKIPVRKGDRLKWKSVSNRHQQRLLEVLNAELARSTDPRVSAVLHELIDAVAQKRALARRLRDDIRMQGLMEGWLFLHIPLTFALIGALVAHVVSVFVYW
jgi:hypothetical protein